jgi:pimeloyl-ACP methyl ester carboxylesterase
MISGRLHGLAYNLIEPQGPPRGGVLVLHGAGSCKENHLDFAHACAAAGLAALAFDQRGHGESEGALGAGSLDDVATMVGVLRDAAGTVPLFLRGSSMGGFVALVIAEHVGAAGVVAVCPAAGQLLAETLREGGVEFPADAAALLELVAACDLEAAARALGPRLLLVHAEGDERVPIAHTRRLHAAAPGSRLIVAPGGDHSSAQHDPQLRDAAVRFLVELTAQR